MMTRNTSNVQLCHGLISPESKFLDWDLHVEIIWGDSPKKYNSECFSAL